PFTIALAFEKGHAKDVESLRVRGLLRKGCLQFLDGFVNPVRLKQSAATVRPGVDVIGFYFQSPRIKGSCLREVAFVITGISEVSKSVKVLWIGRKGVFELSH